MHALRALLSPSGRRHKAASAGDWIDATVTAADLAQWRYEGRVDQRGLVDRAVGVVWVCAELRAKYAASVPIRLYRPSTGRGRKVRDRRTAEWLRSPHVGLRSASLADRAGDIEEVLDHPVLTLLRDPNPQQTGVEYRRFRFIAQYITGNAYDLCARDDGQPPVYLLPLFPQHVGVVPGTDRLIDRYTYGRPGVARVEYDADDIIHSKHMPSLTDPYFGVGCLHAVSAEVDLLSAALTYEQAYWSNYAMPTVMVSVKPGMGPEGQRALDKWLQSRYRGPRNAGKAAVIEGIESITQLQSSAREMQYREGRDALTRLIQQAFGVFGMLERPVGGVNIGSDGRTAEEEVFLRQTIAPDVAAYCETLTERLLPMYGVEPGELWFAGDNPVREDELRLREANRADVAAGILTANEAREDLGREPLPAPSAAPIIPPLGGPEPEAIVGDKTARGHGGCCAHGSAPRVTSLRRSMYEPLPPRAWKARRTIVELTEPELRRGLEAFYDALNAEIDAALLEEGRITLSPEAQRRAFEAFARATGQPLTDLIVEGYRVGAVDARVAVPDVLTEAAREAVRGYQERLYRLVTATHTERLASVLEESIARGDSLAERVSAVREAAGASGYAAERIARTEAPKAYSHGRIAAWRSSGRPVRKRWQLSGDPCPLCEGLARRAPVVALDEPFAPLGTVIVGGDGRAYVLDYEDVMSNPAHPNCGCDITLEYADEEAER